MICRASTPASRRADEKPNPLGVKQSRQAGWIAAARAVMNALLDALSPLGITYLDIVATPLRIWQAIHHALDITEND
jgi:carbon-monoxide dehydrogenase large subunit